MADGRIEYGGEEIPYTVRFRESNGRKLAIHVLPDGTVRVDAPFGTGLSEVKEGVRKRARWVAQHLARIREQRQEVLPRRYVSGESHYYLGRRHLLKVQEAEGECPGVKLLRGTLCVTTRDRSPEAVRSLLWRWYRERAREICARRLTTLATTIPWLNGSPPPFRLLQMRKQWGSCSPKGTLLLNPHLVKAPGECINYVILHEVCHLRERNHSERFYRLLSQAMPDWRTVKRRLDGSAELLLNV